MEDLETYEKYLHESIFPPEDPYEVREFSIDGNKKVIMKPTQGTAPLKIAGRPSQRRKNRKPYSNGWLMITDPSTG